MQNPRALLTLIIVAVLIVAGIVVVLSFHSISINQVTEAPPNEIVEDLRQDISAGIKMELAYPLKSVFSVGDVFKATLGISNTLDQPTDFQITVTKRAGLEGVIVHSPSSTGTLQPGDSFFGDITFSTAGAEPGSYHYDITAQVTESEDIYEQKTIAFTLMGSVE
jgi:hypothetical protein